MKTFYVYLLTNKNNTVLYTGFTDDIERRLNEHKAKISKKSFTARYNCNKLIYFEEFQDVNDALHREKQLKRYSRKWKENLINENNSDWVDLSKSW
ncbi:MAG: GIY-YIG nuclease family protein [Flavobacteriales bacterium]|nr:GIY-YIG nuclease family protein [Flavobacteriales bacterium]NQX97044.1 GIY-YIG nuclease family protein [Flavobacteriales bacterium]